jgi:hypothetical protein
MKMTLPLMASPAADERASTLVDVHFRGAMTRGR